MRCKRTGSFSPEDFDKQQLLIKHFGKPLVSATHVLNQVSNLTDLKGNELLKVRSLPKDLIETIEETMIWSSISHQTQPSSVFDSPMPESPPPGSKGVIVVTADLQLFPALEDLGIDSLNFNHVRALGWS